jgi:hypothetical protein
MLERQYCIHPKTLNKAKQAFFQATITKLEKEVKDFLAYHDPSVRVEIVKLENERQAARFRVITSIYSDSITDTAFRISAMMFGFEALRKFELL